MGLKISAEIQTRDSKLSPLVSRFLLKSRQVSPLVEMGLKISAEMGGTQS